MSNFGTGFSAQITNPFKRHDLLSGGVASLPDPFALSRDIRFKTATETKQSELLPDGSRKYPGGPVDARLADEQAKSVAAEQKIANELRKAAADMARSESDLARLSHLPEDKFVEFRTEVLDYAKELASVQNTHIEKLVAEHAAGPPDADNWDAADELENAERETTLISKYVKELQSLGKGPKDILRAQQIRDRLESIAGKVKDRELTQLDIQPPVEPALLEEVYEDTQVFVPHRRGRVRRGDNKPEEPSPFARRERDRGPKRTRRRGSFDAQEPNEDFEDAF